MGLSTPVASRMAAGAILLLLFLALPAADAQMPAPVGSAALAITVVCPDTLLEPNWAGQDTAMCELQDLSRDAVVAPGSTSGTGPSAHTVTWTTRPVNASAEALGWQVLLSESMRSVYGGDVIPFFVNVKATPLIDTQEYDFELVVEYLGPGGHNQTIVVPFSAEVNPYDIALVSWATPASQVQRAGQDEVITYPVLITNNGVFPDVYRFTVKTDPGVKVTTPSNVYVPAGESRVVNISVLTPKGKLYEMGRSVPINIKVNSVGVAGIGGTGVYSTVGVLQIRGPYVSTAWIPLVLVGAVSAAVVTRGVREKTELRRLEKGRPRPVALTPRQEILLAELRRTDPDGYKEKRAALERVYKERLVDYRGHRRERLAADREEAKQARIEFLAQKKRRKAERVEQKRQAKAERRAAKAEAKLVKKKEKTLAKKRKVLEKAKAKDAKRQAKVDAKQAKIDAKNAKKAEKEARKAEKAARKAKK